MRTRLNNQNEAQDLDNAQLIMRTFMPEASLTVKLIESRYVIRYGDWSGLKPLIDGTGRLST